jgi:tRNA (guanine-N7-)-methyltransferase
MRSRYQPLAIPTLQKSAYVVQDLPTLNDVDILEIGCGKGQFLLQHAKQYPQLSHVGVEQSSDVLYRAVQKLENEPLENVRFVWGNVDTFMDQLPACQTLYLQFSDPWPKARHEKRRLTTPKRLLNYYKCVQDTLYFKTDNRNFFEYSLEAFQSSPFHLESFGVLSHEPSDITTEFEDKYRRLHKPIYYIEAKK